MTSITKNDEIVGRIRKTYDYDKFITEDQYENKTRVMWLVYQSDKISNISRLPLVEVKPEGEKLRVVGDLDSFKAAKEMHLPVYYFNALAPVFQYKRRLDLDETDIWDLLDAVNWYKTLEKEGELN